LNSPPSGEIGQRAADRLPEDSVSRRIAGAGEMNYPAV